MMRLEQHKPFFKALADQPSQISRRKLLEQATKDQINMLSEVILNLLKRNVSVDPSLMARLRKHKHIERTTTPSTFPEKTLWKPKGTNCFVICMTWSAYA